MKARIPLLPLAALGLLTVLTACGSATTGTTTAESAVSSPAATASSASASPSPTGSATSAEPSAAATTRQPTVQEVTPPPSTSADPEPVPTGTVITVEPTASTQNPAASGSQFASSAAGVAVCDYDQLYIEAAVAQGGGAAGSRYITLTFTNTGDANCTMSGYPAVHYVNAAGQQVGAVAANATEWSSSGGVIAPGDSLTATLRETRAQLYGDACQSVSAAGYSVQAPGASQALVLNFAAEACSNTSVAQLSVGAVGATP